MGLMTSRRKLQRCDSYPERLRGLMDAATGECFLIEEEKLLAAQSLP